MPADPAQRALEALLAQRSRGALVTLKRDGRPQLSNVAYRYDVPGRKLHISTTDTRAKTRNLRRDPRASFYVTTEDLSSYVVVEAVAQLSPVATGPHDAAADALVDHYRAVRGHHSDWEEFRGAMVGEGRLLIHLQIDRLYGYTPGS